MKRGLSIIFLRMLSLIGFVTFNSPTEQLLGPRHRSVWVLRLQQW